MKEDAWSRGQRLIFWLAMAATLFLPRLLLQQALPIYLFSDDSHSYLLSAFHWTQTGDWATSPRRGAVYSLLAAGVLRVFQNLNVLPLVQHVLGGAAVLIAIGILRAHLSRWACWLALPICAAYALAGFPIFFEQTIRSETLLLLFSTSALASWAWFLRLRRTWLLLAAGVAFGLATLIKNLLLPFPVAVAACLLAERAEKWPARWRRVALLTAGSILPFLANEGVVSLSGRPEAAPQAGILLYGRVAQWTVLDSAPQPEVKRLIRADIEQYRQLPRLNNNIILKRSAVPHLAAWLRDRGGSRAELNRICRDLALEAILAEPHAWAAQIWSDLTRLHGKMEFPIRTPDAGDLQDARSATSKMKDRHPMLRQAEVLARLDDPQTAASLSPYHHVVALAWLFRWHPVLLTTLLLPVLLVLDRSPARRPFWLTAALVWFFNVAIICTVGRPIPRYLIAVLPIIFWTLGGALLLGGGWLASRFKARHPASARRTPAASPFSQT